MKIIDKLKLAGAIGFFVANTAVTWYVLDIPKLDDDAIKQKETELDSIYVANKYSIDDYLIARKRFEDFDFVMPKNSNSHTERQLIRKHKIDSLQEILYKTPNNVCRLYLDKKEELHMLKTVALPKTQLFGNITILSCLLSMLYVARYVNFSLEDNKHI